MVNNSNKRRKRSSGRKARIFDKKMESKLVALYILVLLAFCGLIFRLFVINRDNGEEYKKKVLSQLSYDSRDLPFKRGTITDAKGTVLADSELVYNVIIDSYQINNGGDGSDGESEYLEPTMKALEGLGIDTESLRAYVRKNPASRYYIAKKNLPYVDKVAFEDAISTAEANVKKIQNSIKTEEEGGNDPVKLKSLESQLASAKEVNSEYSKIKGVWFEAAYIRSYPNKTLASNVIGFATDNNEGNFGIEEYYNDILNGTPGREYGYLNDSSTLERTTIEATDGYNLQLTLDANIQSIIEKYLKEFNDEYADNGHEGYGANNVACIIQDVNNGNILGMANYPDYDLSDPYDMSRIVGMPKLNDVDQPTDEYMTQEDVDALTDSEQKTRYLNSLWRNFCISTYYEPGSVAKPFTLAAGLETGKMTGDETYYCGGYLNIDGWDIYCHNRKGDGILTVDQSIERSCNVALMQMAQTIGISDFCKFQRIFNFGLKTNIDLADEARTDTLLISKDRMTNSDLATNSFGQNFDTTMIQMITGFSSLINGGNYWEPHLVSKITDSSGATIKTIEPRLVKKTVSEATSAKIREATLAVVAGANGTGHTARPAGYMIGGKTGTAETLPRGNHKYVVSFMGYAPADDPQIAIYVVVDRVNVDYDLGDAKYATRICRKILTEVLPYLNIYMTEELSESEIEELKQLKLDNTLALGASTFDNISKTVKYNIDTDGDGVNDSLDANGDGKADTPMDSDGDGINDSADTDGDGIADYFDTDNDGVCDSATPPAGSPYQVSQSALDAQAADSGNTSAGTRYWTAYSKDPVTGNYIDPVTGNQIDPATGQQLGTTVVGEDNAGADVLTDPETGTPITGKTQTTTQSEGEESDSAGAEGAGLNEQGAGDSGN